MKIIDCEQGTEEWFAARLGKVTASHFADVMAQGRGGSASKTRATYMKKLRIERRYRVREGTFHSKYMDEGWEKEPDARDFYEIIYGAEVKQVGYIEKTEDVGCSPDGLVGADGVVEFKCPLLRTHRDYLDADALPSVYRAQVQGQLWVCERQWCDFVSYHPDAITLDGIDETLFVVRVERDEAFLTLLSAAVATFVEELLRL